MSSCSISSKHCLPCEGGSPPLTETQINELKQQLTTPWEIIDNHKLRQKFKFKNFKEAIAFVNKVAELAESEGHHPDLKINYNKVTIELSTHSIDGLSENDFIMAGNIEKL